MIFDKLIELLLIVPNEILEQIPTVTLSEIPIPIEFYEWFEQMFIYSKLFFPMELVSYIISTVLALRLIRVQIAGYKFISSSIPFLT